MNAATDIANKGHNIPPVTPPSEQELLDDLNRRYPNVKTRCAEFVDAAKTFPDEIKDDDTAGKVQALFKQMASETAAWSGQRKLEKGPWSTLADVAFNFFKTPEDTIKGWQTKLKDRHTAYGEVKAERARIEAEEVLKSQREESERLAQVAREAEERKVAAEKAEREAREREEAAEREAVAAEQRRIDAEARARAAKDEEDRLAREKRERDAKARADRQADLKALASLVHTAQGLSENDVKDIIPAEDREYLGELLSTGGKIAALGQRLVADLELLPEIDRAKVQALRDTVRTLRDGFAERREHEATETKRAQDEADRAEREAATARRLEREAEEEKLRLAREERLAEEALAAAAKQEKKDAQAEVREARTEQREARGDVREADKEARVTGAAAERTEARVDRMERKLDNATDADLSRTRGEHGTVGSLTGRWHVQSVDHNTVDLERLRGYLMPAAIDAAVYRYMQANRTQNEITPLTGAEFEWIPDSVIR